MKIEKIILKNEFLGNSLFSVHECNNVRSLRHSHDFLEFVYVVRGSAEHTINDRSTIISKGDYFLINLNSTHEYRAIAGDEEFLVINCLFRPAFIEPSLSDRGGLGEILDNFLIEFGHSRSLDRITDGSYHDQDGFIGTLVAKMLAEANEMHRGSSEMIRHLLICLLVCLVRNAEDEESGKIALSRRIKKYVADNYMHKIRLSDISRELNFSLTYTSICFKRECEMSFRDYLTKVRIEKACDLLRLTEKTVSEIASLVGYEDDTFFYRAFRRCLGMTPIEYKKNRK